jgi:hypothetical protein
MRGIRSIMSNAIYLKGRFRVNIYNRNLGLMRGHHSNLVSGFRVLPHGFRIRINSRIPEGFLGLAHGFRKRFAGAGARIPYWASGWR